MLLFLIADFPGCGIMFMYMICLEITCFRASFPIGGSDLAGLFDPPPPMVSWDLMGILRTYDCERSMILSSLKANSIHD